jgi:hypothetical protein
LVVACGSAHPLHAARTRSHVTDLFGKKQLSLLPELTAAQAVRFCVLRDSPGGCRWLEAAVVSGARDRTPMFWLDLVGV